MNVWRLIFALGYLAVASACTTVSEPARPRAASSNEAAVANLTVGAAYVRQGRPDLAIEALQRALRLDPRLADAHSTLAIAYDQTGDLGLAEEHYLRATSLDQDNGAAANSYAVFLCRQNRWSEAEPYFRRAVDSAGYATPDVALANAGVCARAAGAEADADAYFREALTRNNTSAPALTGLLELAYAQEEYLQARAFLQRLGLQRADAGVLEMCVRIETELGDSAAAADCTRRLNQNAGAAAEAPRR